MKGKPRFLLRPRNLSFGDGSYERWRSRCSCCPIARLPCILCTGIGCLVLTVLLGRAVEGFHFLHHPLFHPRESPAVSALSGPQPEQLSRSVSRRSRAYDQHDPVSTNRVLFRSLSQHS